VNKDSIIQAYAKEKSDVLKAFWEEMMRILDILMTEDEPKMYTDGRSEVSARAWADDLIAYGENRGQAQGMAFAIAILEQVYSKPPDVPGVKERAIAMWEELNEEED